MPNTTDFYSQCESALAVRLRTLTDFFPHEWQVSDDDSVIAKGANNFLIYSPGAFPFANINMSEKDFSWDIPSRMYVKYIGYSESKANFKALRAAIINLIFPDFSLSGTPGVWRTSVSSQESSQYFFFDEPKPGVRPNFIIQDLTFTITQRVGFDI